MQQIINSKDPDIMRKLREQAVEAMASDSPVDRISRMMFPLAFFLFKGRVKKNLKMFTRP